MNILVYKWKAYNYRDIIETFRMLGHHVDIIEQKLESYDEDEVFAERLNHILKGRAKDETFTLVHYDFVFTVNYFAVISNVCELCNIKYVVWTCDNPLISMYHKSIFNKCNDIFTFDKTNYYELKEMGVKRVFHLPLAVDVDRMDAVIASNRTTETKQKRNDCGIYNDDITFIGSLYERNTYDKIQHRLPPYLAGYFDAVIRAQINISGGNIVEKMLTPDILAQLSGYFELNKSKDSFSNLGLIFATTVLGFKIAATQRVECLNELSKKHQVSVYSNSDISQLPLCDYRGSVDYWSEMPSVFHKSKLNVNLTIPNIKSGIPLRAWDVLGSGGFLMTNFQAELLLYFKPDEDLVIFESIEELEEKADYYLKHEEERKRIAENGRRKVKEHHSYKVRLQEMLEKIAQP